MSKQQDLYLQLRANGATMMTAAAEAEIPADEARLIENEIARGELTLPEAKPITPAAGDAVLSNKDTEMQDNEATETWPEGEDPLVELAADTLRGDIRDSLLDWIKALPKAWAQMGESEQRDMAAAANRFAGTLIKEACSIIAAGERRCIVATLTEYREKDGVEAKLKLPSRGEVVAALHEACGREVLVVTSGAEDFMGQAADAEITADQPELHGIGAEYQDAA